MEKLKQSIVSVSGTVLMLVLALLIGARLVALTGNSPREAYEAIWNGAFGSPQKKCEIFVKLSPILLMGFGISIAFRSQLWNIGSAGQFVMGSIAATAVGLYMPGPAIMKWIISFAAAIAAGGLWAALAGFLKIRFNANEVITTLMLSYIADYFLLYLINGPMQDPSSDLAQSAAISDNLKLMPLIGTYRLNTSVFILITVCAVMFVFWKSDMGYRIDLVGQGRKVATYAGIHVNKTILMTMFLSGAMAGLAGWIETYGIQFRILENLEANYGDIANIIALLGALNPAGILASAVFFAILLVGGASMQRMTSVPYSVVDVIQGLIIIFIIAKAVIRIHSPKTEKKAKEGGNRHAQ